MLASCHSGCTTLPTHRVNLFCCSENQVRAEQGLHPLNPDGRDPLAGQPASKKRRTGGAGEFVKGGTINSSAELIEASPTVCSLCVALFCVYCVVLFAWTYFVCLLARLLELTS